MRSLSSVLPLLLLMSLATVAFAVDTTPAPTPQVPTVYVGANPQTITLDTGTTAIITAKLLGTDISNKVVQFAASKGALSAAQATTDVDGLASVTLTVGNRDLGTAQVAISTGNATATTTVEIAPTSPAPRAAAALTQQPTLPPYQSDFSVSVDPSSMPADGQSVATVSVRLTDPRGLPIRTQNVIFSTPLGRVEPQSMTNQMGYASVHLYAPDQPAQTLVFAQAGTLRGYAMVTYVPVSSRATTGAPHLYLRVSPGSTPADGMSTMQVGVLLLDSNGYAIPNTPIDFASTLGTLQNGHITTDQSGQAGTLLLAASMPGSAMVTAKLNGITAATLVMFQGPAQDGGLNVRSWSTQQTAYAAESWLYRVIQTAGHNQASISTALLLLDQTGKVVKTIDTDTPMLLVLDQNGVAHGYGTVSNGVAKIALLKADGSALRTITTTLPTDSQLLNLQYAEPSGQLLLSAAKPDGSMPTVAFFGPDGAKFVSLADGLDTLPIAVLGGDGYLGVALAKGVVSIYDPQGKVAAQIHRADTLPASQLVIGPAGAWVAVASALAGQTQTPPHLTVLPRQGVPLLDTAGTVVNMAAAGKDGLLVGSADGVKYFNLTSKNIDWSLPGTFDLCAVYQGMGLIAGLHDPQAKSNSVKILLVRLKDGKILASQTFDTLGDIKGILSPDAAGLVGVISTNSAFRFALPTP